MSDQPHKPDADLPPPEACPDRAELLKCRHCVDFLLDYVDGALAPAQVQAFEQHFVICPNCRVYLDNYRKAAALTAGLAPRQRHETASAASPAVPAGLVDAILRARKQGGE